MSFIRGPKYSWSGLLFIAVGLATVIMAADYPMGSTGRMGAGYFPRALGILLIPDRAYARPADVAGIGLADAAAGSHREPRESAGEESQEEEGAEKAMKARNKRLSHDS